MRSSVSWYELLLIRLGPSAQSTQRSGPKNTSIHLYSRSLNRCSQTRQIRREQVEDTVGEHNVITIDLGGTLLIRPAIGTTTWQRGAPV
jgi:hypothetical protein